MSIKVTALSGGHFKNYIERERAKSYWHETFMIRFTQSSI